MRFFVTGTGTDVGKTYVTRSLALALRAHGEKVVALKPLETGCDPEPLDAIALAEACARPELAHLDGLYRRRPPLAPLAATLAGEAPLDWRAVRAAVRPFLDEPNVIVEGAGGLLVPVDAQRTIADLAMDLALPLIVVAPDGLGVLSHVLTTLESAARRHLPVAAVVLRQPPAAEAARDCSITSNVDILATRTEAPVLRFPWVSSNAELTQAGRVILNRMRRAR